MWKSHCSFVIGSTRRCWASVVLPGRMTSATPGILRPLVTARLLAKEIRLARTAGPAGARYDWESWARGPERVLDGRQLRRHLSRTPRRPLVQAPQSYQVKVGQCAHFCACQAIAGTWSDVALPNCHCRRIIRSIVWRTVNVFGRRAGDECAQSVVDRFSRRAWSANTESKVATVAWRCSAA
jgi:hypothetical protein